MKEEKAVAIMMGNLKGSKNKITNLTEFAKACRKLKNDWGFPEMSRHFRVSQYMLRQIDKINELSPKLQKFVEDENLGIEAAYQLWRIDEPKRTQVAEVIKGMNTDDIRSFIYILKKNDKLSVSDAKKLFEKSQPEKIKLLVLPLDTQTYDALEKSASKSKLTIHNYALKTLQRNLFGKEKK